MIIYFKFLSFQIGIFERERKLSLGNISVDLIKKYDFSVKKLIKKSKI